MSSPEKPRSLERGVVTKDPEVITATTFIVDGKTVDANGKEVKSGSTQASSTEGTAPEVDVDASKPAPKPAPRK